MLQMRLKSLSPPLLISRESLSVLRKRLPCNDFCIFICIARTKYRQESLNNVTNQIIHKLPPLTFLYSFSDILSLGLFVSHEMQPSVYLYTCHGSTVN